MPRDRSASQYCMPGGSQGDSPAPIPRDARFRMIFNFLNFRPQVRYMTNRIPTHHSFLASTAEAPALIETAALEQAPKRDAHAPQTASSASSYPSSVDASAHPIGFFFRVPSPVTDAMIDTIYALVSKHRQLGPLTDNKKHLAALVDNARTSAKLRAHAKAAATKVTRQLYKAGRKS